MFGILYGQMDGYRKDCGPSFGSKSAGRVQSLMCIDEQFGSESSHTRIIKSLSRVKGQFENN